MKKTKVICVGEALIDRIKNKSNQEFKDFLGGAPANVACALSKLKIDSAFIGRLGIDEFGQRFIDEFNSLNVNINFLQLDNNSPTRVVIVNRDDLGDRYFSGFDASSNSVFADEVLDKKLLENNFKTLEKLFMEAKYFVSGTNVLSSSMSEESIYFLLNLAKSCEVKIVIDLNWREVFWEYSTFGRNYSTNEKLDSIKNFLECAHILKLAKEEALLFFDIENPFEISQKMRNRPDVIVTDGAKPISWFINGIKGTTQVINSSKIVDTTGAGDAFLAGLISKFISINYPKNEIEIQNCVTFASICGLLTCFGEGAIEQQPNYDKVNDFLGSQIL